MAKFPEIDLSVLNGAGNDQNAEQSTAKSDLPEPTEERDWKSLRNAAPLNKLLDSTMRWTEELPPEIRPLALMAKYPRLANMAAASWKQSSAFHDYLDILLVDRRGGRKGFSSDILVELEQLRTYYFYGWYKSATGVSIYRDGVSDPLRFAADAKSEPE